MNLLECLLPSVCAPCDEVKEVKVVHIPRSSLAAWAHAADQVREDEASSPHSAGPQFWSWSRMTSHSSGPMMMTPIRASEGKAQFQRAATRELQAIGWPSAPHDPASELLAVPADQCPSAPHVVEQPSSAARKLRLDEVVRIAVSPGMCLSLTIILNKCSHHPPHSLLLRGLDLQ